MVRSKLANTKTVTSYTNNQSLCKNQLEQASLLALAECEKFYPAFQIFAWDNKDVKSTIQHLMLETHGEV